MPTLLTKLLVNFQLTDVYRYLCRGITNISKASQSHPLRYQQTCPKVSSKTLKQILDKRGLSGSHADLTGLAVTPVTVYFCYPEDWKGWIAGLTAFVLGRSNSMVTHVCFKVGETLQVDYNCGGTQIYFEKEPRRPVAHALVCVLKDYRVLSRVKAFTKSEDKFHWSSVLPSLWNSIAYTPSSPTCCSFTLSCLLDLDLHFDPDNLRLVLAKRM